MERQGNISAPPLEVSANLAKPLANPWRNRILAELLLHPMSPKQFTAEFGGPGLPTIARYFRELKDWGFLEVAEELRGGKRRGAIEKVYRAIQRVHFDTPTWEKLPRYLRSECSTSMMEGLIARITEAVQAETFEVEKDRHLSWKALQLDRKSWSEYSARLDEVLETISELEVESADRLTRDDDDPLLATIGMLSFRSPPAPVDVTDPAEEWTRFAEDGDRPHFLMSPRTAKALANPWRNRILAELHLRPMSPKQFVEEVEGPDLSTVARYFRQLKKWGYLEVVEELRGGKRRGSVEKIYQAIRRVHFNTPTWEELPLELRRACSVSMLDELIQRINEAVAADTFDAETDRHLSWKTALFDRQGWTELGAVLDEILAWAESLECESAKRLSRSEGEEIPATIALLAFRSPERQLAG